MLSLANMNAQLLKSSSTSKPILSSSKSKSYVQPKLNVNTPGDIYEQEADAMADRVMRMSSNETSKPLTGLIGKSLQRKCSHCEEEEKKKKPLMRKTDAGNTGMSVSSSFASSLNASKGSGSPLPQGTRSFMENAFSVDFSAVKIHTGSQASEMSKGINAKAFTTGNDIYFKGGEYSPNSESGKKLLAHELTHVVQQGSRIPPKIQRLGDLSKVPTMPCNVSMTSSGGTPALSSLFPTSATSLSASQRNDIAQFVISWRASGGTDRLRVDGYASNPGTDEINWQLSCERALAVANELRSNGVLNSFITIFANGETAEFGAQANNQRANISIITSPSPSPAAPAIPSCTTPINPDMSGSSFNPTTSSQAAIVASHPIDAFTVNSDADTALAAAQTSGLPGLYLGRADAFRHCFWNCLMTQHLGAAEAEQFATGHENSGPSTVPFDNQMDLHNNALGRSLGAPGSNCQSLCMSAVSSGTLRTIRGPNADGSASSEGLSTPVPPVTSACIGASSQPWP